MEHLSNEKSRVPNHRGPGGGPRTESPFNVAVTPPGPGSSYPYPPQRGFANPVMLPKAPKLPTIEIIKNRLYWSCGPKPPTATSEAFFFSIDEEL